MNPSPAIRPGGRLLDPAALMRLGTLELRARWVVEGFRHGLHRSPYHGFSVEFTEYRQYTPGDDPRFLDWRVFGRSDRYYLKKFEDETNLRCHLLVDRSRSMAFGSAGHPKAAYAATLAATLAHFLDGQGDAVGLLTFAGGVRDFLPARHRPGQLRRLTLLLEGDADGPDTDLVPPLEQVGQVVRKRGLVVLVSDLLAPVDRLERSLSMLTAAGHEVVVFQVLDPAEIDFSFTDAALFEDLESGRTVYIDPAVIRESYRERLAAHGRAVQETCERLGAAFHRVPTSRPLELALLEFIQDRERTGARLRPGRAGRGSPAGGRP